MDESRRRQLIPTIAVVAVAVAAVLASWLTLRPSSDSGRPERPLDVAVVRAPPITVPNTAVAGGPPARAADCPTCGVVEAVSVQQDHATFQLRVRMSDGSLRTLEQNTPVVAGSRVVVEGGVARPAPGPATQG
jgi:hypothetical protein